jgi:hypothetical protein
LAEKIVSPGVFTNEIDQTFLPSAVSDIGAVLIGPTVKGPAGIPTVVTSYSEYQRLFGDSFKSGSQYYQYLTSHTAEQYLKNSDTLTVVRVLAGNFSKANAEISASIDPKIVGGGTKNTGSFTVVEADSVVMGGTLQATSCSITPNGGSEVKFIFTASAQKPGTTGGTTIDGVTNDTATIIYVNSASAGNVAASRKANAENLRDAINISSSLHGLEISASTDGANEVGISSSRAGNLGVFVANSSSAQLTPLIHGSQGNAHFTLTGLTGDITTTTGSGGGTDFGQSSHGISPSTKISFTLKTLADGANMNNYETSTAGTAGSIGSNALLPSGSRDNIRWEIAKTNLKKGTFTLNIRRGDDTEKRKQVLETFNNVSLDPNTSKLVKVDVTSTTIDYLDENGNVREGGALSSSLPHYSGSAFSGSLYGAFKDGTDGILHPIQLYEDISENSSQGLDPSGDGGSNGYNQYIETLNLISNPDEYDFNLILTPGIISMKHTSIASKIIDICEKRGDCFAILDPVTYGNSITNVIGESEGRNSNFAAMYWPWVKISDSQVAGTQRWVPPSVVMAGVYSFNDKVAHPWFAPAGLNRGTVNTAIQAERKLTQNDRDTLYDSNVNPLATFPGQGVTVFGQKTLQKKASALDRVNVRRLLIRVKKFIASSSRFLVFEQNTQQTRRVFLNLVNPFLEKIQSESGLSAFRVVMDDTNNTPDTIDRNQLVGQLFIQPTRTAEFIILDFTVQPTGAAFPE